MATMSLRPTAAGTTAATVDAQQQHQQHTPTISSGSAAAAAAVRVLCCLCGVSILPNAANTCAQCLASTADITRGIATEATLHQCRACQRWHVSAGKWMSCELESRELMSLCLQHVSGLRGNKSNSGGGGGGGGGGGRSRVRLVDAVWIWTEPHSMRLKVKLTIQRQVGGGSRTAGGGGGGADTILQQSFTVTFIVRNQQCIECQAVFRQGSWKSVVQVRQRVQHKRTFLYLEQLILKQQAHRGCLKIETFRNGMDFYFPDKSKAARFIHFLESVCPTKVKASKKLISTDDKSNIANFKYTNLVEICPLCKDDMLFLPAATARSLGNISRLVLVRAVSDVLHLVDPTTGQQGSMTAEAYWRRPIRPLVTAARSRMTEYTVLDKEPVFLRPTASKRKTGRRQRTRLAALTLARRTDLGANDRQFSGVACHCGYLFRSGDACLGYDLHETQFVDDEAETLREEGKLPDVVVVRKLYGSDAVDDTTDESLRTAAAAAAGGGKRRRRIWRLQRLDGVERMDDDDDGKTTSRRKRKRKTRAELKDDDQIMRDEEEFLEQVEADREMRQNMNLYKDTAVVDRQGQQQETEMKAESKNAGGDDDDEGEDDQQVKLDELLDGLALDQGPDDEDIAGDDSPSATGFAAGRNGGTSSNCVDDGGDDLFRALDEGERAAADGIGYIQRQQARLVPSKEAAVAVVSGAMAPAFDLTTTITTASGASHRSCSLLQQKESTTPATTTNS